MREGIEKQGNQVDMFDGERDRNVKLTIYQYIVIGRGAIRVLRRKDPGFRADLPCRLRHGLGEEELRLRLPKATFGAAKSLSALMKCMEGEGMLIKTSDILRSSREAEEIGKRLHI